MSTQAETAGNRALRIGIVGIGGAAVNMLPAFKRNPQFRIAAAADLDVEILARFRSDFPGTETFQSVEAMAACADLDLIYIATPSVLHAEHARLALEGGKHVLIEKPMAVTLDEADAMIAAADANGVLLGVNVKHSFEPRVLRIREFVRSGELGKLRMLHSWRYVDWLYRPRTEEELTPGWGSGILWRQGPHQLDIVRTICGGMLRTIRGSCQTFDPERRVTGAYTALLEFEDGTVASAVCSGYDHFDSQSLVYGFDGDATTTDPARHARARRELKSHSAEPGWEAKAAAAERYGGGREGGGPVDKPNRTAGDQASGSSGPRGGWLSGGPLIASFERADIRLSGTGLAIDADDRQWRIEFPRGWDGRDGRLVSFYHAIINGAPMPADGRWGKATQEALVALQQSSDSRAEVPLKYQSPTVDVGSFGPGEAGFGR